ELLKIDAQFFRFHEYAAGLDREVADSHRTIAMWRELAARQATGKPRAAATDATELVREVRALEPLAAADPEMKRKVGRLLGEVWRAAYPVTGDVPFAREARAAAALGEQAQDLRGRLQDAATRLADDSLRELSARLKNLLRQARLGQIDAII